ncbi:hypothetical protein LC593_09995 [Nostoc sp. CHAB 5844]|nr:hypothetical protein [Nostoc sp. CHAB 5844]
MNDELPLLELFTRLRQAGFPLGISEYKAVLQALQGGFGLGDRTDLARLCRSLWVKSSDDEQIFNYHFEQIIGSLQVKPKETQPPAIAVDEHPPSTKVPVKQLLAIAATLVMGVSGAVVASRYLPFPPPQPKPTENRNYSPAIATGLVLTSLLAGTLWFFNRRAAAKDDQDVAQSPVTPVSSRLIPQIQDEVQIAQAVRQTTTSISDELPNKQFLSSSEFFPVTRRQMKQNWRYLRRLVREGPAIELDIAATLDQVGRQGILLHPVLVPRRRNRVELLLLIDQAGSMVPFHGLSSRLAETASREGRLGKTGAYYFHNCPIDYLYQDCYQTNAEKLTSVLARLNKTQSVALIISDAGAARGYFNPDRLELTQAFLNQLQQRIPHIAWLNPVPQSRWHKSTAGAIAKLVPMFEINRSGLDAAIEVLRGRYYPFEQVL